MSDENGTTDTHFTANEIKFLLSALKHAEGGTFKFDADAVAAELGMKDGKIARVRWNTIARTKINNAAPAGGVDKASPAKKAAKPKKERDETPKKRGRKAKKEESSEEGGVKVEEKDDEELV